MRGLMLGFVLVCFSACAEKIVYKEVLVPVKCDVKDRDKPKKSQSLTIYLKEILIYTEGLERDLDYCKGKEIREAK